MSIDPDTIAAYDAQSREYADRRNGRDAEPGLVEFVALLPGRGHLLDLGCGPGDSARRFLDAGFTVDAVDASPEMVACCHELGVDARCASFDDIDGQDIYDGIWASYSLLHVPRPELARHLRQLHRALKPGGKFHIGMKLGMGEKRDRLGRLYVYYTLDELVGQLQNTGFTPTVWKTRFDTGLDGTEYHGIWIHADG